MRGRSRILGLLAWAAALGSVAPALATDSGSVTPEDVAALSPGDAREAVDAIFVEFIHAMGARCSDAAAVETCLNEKYAASLDPTGTFAAFCKVHDEGKEYRFCLLIGAESTPMVIAAGGNLEEDIDWSDVDGMNNAAREQFAHWIMPKCGQQEACVIAQMASALALSPAVAGSCQKHAKFIDQLNCISDTLAVSVYRRAFAAAP